MTFPLEAELAALRDAQSLIDAIGLPFSNGERHGTFPEMRCGELGVSSRHRLRIVILHWRITVASDPKPPKLDAAPMILPSTNVSPDVQAAMPIEIRAPIRTANGPLPFSAACTADAGTRHFNHSNLPGRKSKPRHSGRGKMRAIEAASFSRAHVSMAKVS